jgi:hypothetical protein
MNTNKITTISTLAGALFGTLLITTAFTPVQGADMTFERALSAAKEPQNLLLHHVNYQGHRFSQLKEINTETVKNLKPVFSMALGGIEGAGTRNKSGNLEATRTPSCTSPMAGAWCMRSMCRAAKGDDPLEIRSGDQSRLGRRRRLLRRE